MAIALFTVDRLFAPLQGALRWFIGLAPSPRNGPRPAGAIAPGSPPRVLKFRPGRPVIARGAARHACAHGRARPLRVVRVVDGCPASASAGRMVISGRMADVCAELDRLVALETATP